MAFLQKKCFLLLVLIALCLIAGTFAQRGGGRSRSRSRSSSSRSTWFRSHTKASTNCTTVDGKTTCYDNQSDEAQSLPIAIIIIVIFGGFKLYEIFFKNAQNSKQKKTRENVMDDFVASMEEWPSTLDLGAREEIIGCLKAKSFNMVLTTRASNDPIQCSLQVNSLEKVTDDFYKIKLRGVDDVGRSTLEGRLAFKGDGIAWKLYKDYENKRDAGQTDGFEDLVYEGSGGVGRMEGKWSYYGHEQKPEYSGTWFMVPA